MQKIIYKLTTMSKKKKILGGLVLLLVIGAIGNISDWVFGEANKVTSHNAVKQNPSEYTDDEKLIGDLVGDVSRLNKDIKEYDINYDYNTITIQIEASDNLTNKLIKSGIGIDMFEISKRFSSGNYTNMDRLILTYYTDFIDAKGYTSHEPIIKMEFTREGLSDINWENVIDRQNIYQFGDVMFQHPAFVE